MANIDTSVLGSASGGLSGQPSSTTDRPSFSTPRLLISCDRVEMIDCDGACLGSCISNSLDRVRLTMAAPHLGGYACS